MNKFFKSITLLTILCFTACATGRVPIRAGEVPTQAELSPTEIKYGAAAYNELARQYQLDTDLANGRRIRGIVSKLSNAVGGATGGNPWHIYIFKDDSLKNAAATRGNYIFVWTGMLNAVSSDDELATILAHEVSHVLADHTTPTSGESINQALTGTTAEVARAAAIQSGYGAVANLAGQLTGMLFKAMVTNPGSQRVETEADTIGVYLMAKAGYNPAAALDFWNKVKNDPSFRGLDIAFLSSHPSSEERITNIKKHLPAAMEIYQKSAKQFQ